MISNRQLFQDQVDTDLFFGGGSRREIVEDIKAALVGGVPLVTLTGTDGSGKTMICRMVQKELAGSRELLFFEQGVESFDDIVNRIAARVGLEDSEEQSDRKIRLEKSVEVLNRDERRLIIIIDAAETIFLATLERVRRMLDEVNTERVCIQLLLSGGPLVLLNYKQLGIVTFLPLEEIHFSLDPLNGAATLNYLNHYLERAGGTEHEPFSPALAERIADVARGNFRLIIQLAGRFFDSTRAVDIDEAEIEELFGEGSGADDSDAYTRLSSGLKKVDLDFLKVPKIGARWYAVGGAILILIILFLLFTGEDEENSEVLPGAVDVPELTLEKVEPDPIEIPILPESAESPVAKAPAADLPEDADGPVSEAAAPVETAEPEEAANLSATPAAETVPVASVNQQGSEEIEEPEQEPAAVEAEPLPATETVAAEQVAPTPAAAAEEVESVADSAQPETLQIPKLTVLTQKAPVTEAPAPEVITLGVDNKKKLKVSLPPAVVESVVPEPARPQLRPAQESNERISSAAAEEQEEPSPDPASSIEPPALATPGPVQKRAAPATNPAVYYAERLAAGSRWLVGGSSDKYTVQLMVLNADDAQDNVREMLVEDGYQPIMDKLYILRRSDQPQTVMLYYGEFDSVDEARQAKTRLPSFLNKLDPFEVAVREVVAKARGNL